MRALASDAGRAHVIGVTGPPGVGKSTTTNALVTRYRERGARVGVLAVDPSSPFSGGALLGDRIRMSEHAADPEVFIRSMASRGHLGGLSWAARRRCACWMPRGATSCSSRRSGSGSPRSRWPPRRTRHSSSSHPGMGDGIQAAKAGILEVADVLVVNKGDREGADRAVRDLRHAVDLGDRSEPGSWRAPVVRAVATTGDGVDDVVAAIEEHRAWLGSDGLTARRVRRASTRSKGWPWRRCGPESGAVRRHPPRRARG
jgi:LAO/AO transport system kinase